MQKRLVFLHIFCKIMCRKRFFMGKKQFNYSFLWNGSIPAKAVQLAQGIQALKTLSGIRVQQFSKLHEELEQIARIQSVKSSNAIEGIVTADERILAIVTKSSAPLNHDEEEIAGYRDALALIHQHYRELPFDEQTIRLLHETMLRFTQTADAGRYKTENNLILETDADGNRRIRFQPSSAADTPRDMEQMMLAYREAAARAGENALLLIPCVILDFLSIHPFADGNGRLSRLLTLLLLYRQGFDVGRYISLEAQINTYKGAYYQALHDSSQGWQENEQDYFPFVENFLSLLYLCYKELDKRFGATQGQKVNKTQRIEAAVLNALLPLSKADICTMHPDISPSTVEAVLGAMVRAGRITRIGAGRASRYVRA